MRPLETASGLAAVLRGVVADMQHASGADIVSIFPNQRVRELEALAVDLLAREAWTSYAIGTRPAFDNAAKPTAIAPRGNTR